MTVCGLYVLLCIVAGIALAELSLRLPRRPESDGTAFRAHVGSRFRAAVLDVSLAAQDGAELRAWYADPGTGTAARNPDTHGTVILLHGITATRDSSMGFAEMFLREGYAVLLPDSRDHGRSGGALTTYGLLERYDVARWAAWARAREPGCVYLLGESLGAAIALQATAVTPGLCAVVAEDPYSTFWSLAPERLGRGTRKGELVWRTAGLPVLGSAVLWARLR